LIYLILVLVHIYIEVRGFENQLKNIEKEKERNEIEKYVGLYARRMGCDYEGGARGVNFSFNPSLGKILFH